MELVASQLEQLVESPERGLAGRDGSKTERGLRFRELLAQQIGEERLSLWFGNAARWEFDHNVLSITLDNQFLIDCVRSFCWDELMSVVAEFGNPAISIQLLFDSKLSQPTSANSVQGMPRKTIPPMKLNTALPSPPPARTVVASQGVASALPPLQNRTTRLSTIGGRSLFQVPLRVWQPQRLR